MLRSSAASRAGFCGCSGAAWLLFLLGLGCSSEELDTQVSGAVGGAATDLPAAQECDRLPTGTERLATGLRIFELAAFQAVKASIVYQMVEVSPRKAEIVANRPAFFRAYVAPEPGWVPRIVRAKLVLQNTGPSGALSEKVFTRTMTLDRDSIDRDLDSTFNFEVSADSITTSTRYSLSFFETQDCPAVSPGTGARLPEAGFLELGARPVGPIRVHLVPMRFLGPDGPLLADANEEQVNLYRDGLFKVFPVEAVEMTVRSEPVDTNAITMEAVLEELATLKDTEKPSGDVTYFGLVRFTKELEEYCAPSCVLGGAFNGDSNSPSAGVAVGIGYTGEAPVGTLVHELGHVYGLPHAPCGVEGDASYPYRGGMIGSWGFDLLQRELIDPMLHLDFMGYCRPVWVSDHSFGHLRSYLSRLNGFEGATSGELKLLSLKGLKRAQTPTKAVSTRQYCFGTP